MVEAVIAVAEDGSRSENDPNITGTMGYLIEDSPNDAQRTGNSDGLLPPREARIAAGKATTSTSVSPSMLVDLGALRGVIYTKDRSEGRKTYVHFMDDPPRLMCDPSGRQLYVRGGKYRITRRGIEG